VKKATLILVSLGALAALAPAMASAHTTRVNCGHPAPHVTTYATGMSCGTAWTVERYWDRHEILTPKVGIAGIRWTIRLNRHAGTVEAYGQRLPRYATYLTAGKRVVEIDSLPYG
jgi:hypothetical protein